MSLEVNVCELDTYLKNQACPQIKKNKTKTNAFIPFILRAAVYRYSQSEKTPAFLFFLSHLYY